MSFSTNPRYVNLAALIPGLKFSDINFSVRAKVHDYWQRYPIQHKEHSINRLVEDFGLHVTIYHHDTQTQALWVHVAAIEQVCNALKVPYPKRVAKTLRQYAISEARYNKYTFMLQDEVDRLAAVRYDGYALLMLDWNDQDLQLVMNIITLEHQIAVASSLPRC